MRIITSSISPAYYDLIVKLKEKGPIVHQVKRDIIVLKDSHPFNTNEQFKVIAGDDFELIQHMCRDLKRDKEKLKNKVQEKEKQIELLENREF